MPTAVFPEASRKNSADTIMYKLCRVTVYEMFLDSRRLAREHGRSEMKAWPAKETQDVRSTGMWSCRTRLDGIYTVRKAG